MKRKNKLFILLIVVIMISLGYSLLSTTLKINGISGIKKNTWNIHWDRNSVDISDGSVDAEDPIVSGTNDNTVTFSADLELPGDYFEFTVDAVNEGTIDGIITLSSKQIFNSSNEELTGDNIPSYLKYSVLYDDGTEPAIDDVLEKRIDDNTPTARKYKIRVEFDGESTSIPSDVETYVFKYTVTYEQYKDNRPYKITFDPNGGVIDSTTKLVERESAIGDLPIPTREAYGFAGWYTEAEGGTQISASTIPEGNVTYYAHWGAMIASNTTGGKTTYYTSLNSAIAASNDGVATLLLDNSENVSVSKKINKTVDLNSKTLTGKFYNTGTITIGGGNITNNSGYTLSNTGKLTVTDGTYTNDTTSNANVYNSGTLTINGGTITSNQHNTINNNASGTLIVNGGLIRSLKTTGNQALYNAGVAHIHGGTFYSGRKVIHVVANSTLNIDGGNFENSSSTGSNIIANLGTVNISGNPVLNCYGSTYATISTQAGSTLNISGGTLTSQDAVINTYTDTNTTISGGTLITNNNSNKWGVKVADGATMTVTGGIIRADYKAGAFRVYEGGRAYINGGKFWNTNSNTTMNVIAIFGYAEMNGGEMIQASSANANTHIYENGKLIINDATITSDLSGSMAIYSDGDLTINGGTFTSSYFAVYIYAGKYEYNGGNINGPFWDNRQL